MIVNEISLSYTLIIADLYDVNLPDPALNSKQRIHYKV